jgi:hypothetical protein
MDADDPLEEFLRQEKKVEDFHKEVQETVVKPKMMKTAADDIIEVIGGHKPPAPPKPTCPKCGGLDFTIRRPLSGPAVKRCTGCGMKTYGGARSPVWMQEGPGVGHGQGTGGAYYSGSATAPVSTEKHAPTSRRKAKSFTALKNKDS